MTVLQLLEVPPESVLFFLPPALVWVWGHAVEQMAIGIERLDDVMCRRRDRYRGAGK